MFIHVQNKKENKEICYCLNTRCSVFKPMKISLFEKYTHLNLMLATYSKRMFTAVLHELFF